MRRSIKAAPLLSACLVLALAAPSRAAEHEVIIVPGGYFPETIYAAPGDTIRFVNAAGAPETIAATDGSWASDPIAIDGTATVAVAEGMAKAYSRHAPGSDGAPLGYIEWEIPAPAASPDAAGDAG